MIPSNYIIRCVWKCDATLFAGSKNSKIIKSVHKNRINIACNHIMLLTLKRTIKTQRHCNLSSNCLLWFAILPSLVYGLHFEFKIQ